MLAASAATLGIAMAAAVGGATATLPPDDTIGTDFIRGQAEAAATEFFVADDPSATNVACVPPSADSPGVETVCYATNAAGEIVTAVATVNDYGDIEMSATGSGQAPTTPTSTPGTVIATFSGEGSAAQAVDPITAPTIVLVRHDGAGEFSVQPQNGGVPAGEPVISTTGAADGRYLVGLAGTISAFAVTADGAWTLELHPIGSAVPLAPGTPAAGDLPDVVAYANSDAGQVTVDYSGTGPIVVRAVTSAGTTVVVDQTAAFTGAVTLPAGPGQLLVDAAGPWALSFPAPEPTTVSPSSTSPTTGAPPTSAAPATSAP